jgi:hypothetical protein
VTQLAELGARYIDGGSEYHVEASLRAFLVTLFPGVPVVVPDDRQRHERPTVSVMHLGSEIRELGAREYQLNGQFDLCYHGRTYNDTVQAMGRMHQVLRTVKWIPLYLYDWRCPRPAVNLVHPQPGETPLPVGDYWLVVSARNQMVDPDESLPSDMLRITLTEPGVLAIDPPLFPHYGTITRDYRAWIGTSPNDLRYMTDVTVFDGNGRRGAFRVSGVPTEVSPIQPLTKSRFYYRPLHVDETKTELERWSREPLWDGSIRTTVHCVLTRELFQSSILRQETNTLIPVHPEDYLHIVVG